MLDHQDLRAQPALKEPQVLKDKEDFKVKQASLVCLGAQEVQEVQEVQEALIEPHLIGPVRGQAAPPGHLGLLGRRATKGSLAYLGLLESLALQEALDQSSLVLLAPQAFPVLQANQASQAHTLLRLTSVSMSAIIWAGTDRLLFQVHQAHPEPRGSLDPLVLWRTYPPV